MARSPLSRAPVCAADMADPRFPVSGDAPYMQVLKGDTWLMRMPFWQNYKRHFDKGSFRPVMHAMLVIGVVGYTLDYFQHLRCEPAPLLAHDCPAITASLPPLRRPLFAPRSPPPPSPSARGPNARTHPHWLCLTPQSSGTRTRRSTSATANIEQWRAAPSARGLAPKALPAERDLQAQAASAMQGLAQGCARASICPASQAVLICRASRAGRGHPFPDPASAEGEVPALQLREERHCCVGGQRPCGAMHGWSKETRVYGGIVASCVRVFLDGWPPGGRSVKLVGGEWVVAIRQLVLCAAAHVHVLCVLCMRSCC